MAAEYGLNFSVARLEPYDKRYTDDQLKTLAVNGSCNACRYQKDNIVVASGM